MEADKMTKWNLPTCRYQYQQTTTIGFLKEQLQHFVPVSCPWRRFLHQLVGAWNDCCCWPSNMAYQKQRYANISVLMAKSSSVRNVRCSRNPWMRRSSRIQQVGFIVPWKIN